MRAKLFFLGAFILLLAPAHGIDIESSLAILRNTTDAGFNSAVNTYYEIENARESMKRRIQDRMTSLEHVCSSIANEVNKTVTNAVFKGMNKNKQFSSFQCISNGANETFGKMISLYYQVHDKVDQMIEKTASGLDVFRMILQDFCDYTRDMYDKKSQIIKTGKEDAVKKALEEAKARMKHLVSISERISGKVHDSEYQFFEEFVYLSHGTESKMKKLKKEGCQKIEWCVI